MRVLILEDEPLIAMDLEDIVHDWAQADCVLAGTVEAGLRSIAAGPVDFALLDFDLGTANSLPVARLLLDERIPFCFISGNLACVPDSFRSVPRLAKPFRHTDVETLLSASPVARTRTGLN